MNVAVPQTLEPIIESIASHMGGRLDQAQARMEGELAGLQIDIPIEHRFTPGMYSREMKAPAGALIVSKVHLSRHQFVISSGSALIAADGEEGLIKVSAPYHGVTEPGTRRLFLVTSELTWTTFHPTELTDVDEIEREIIFDYKNPLLPPNPERKEIEE